MMPGESIQAECWVPADWPLPGHVHAGCSTRLGGYSKPPYDTLNLGDHVGDSESDVIKNREHFRRTVAVPAEPFWLKQTHSNRVIELTKKSVNYDADGAYTCQPGIICTVLTADCVPLLLSSDNGLELAAVHAGWRGFCKDIVAAALAHFSASISHISAWIGPCIDVQHYETDENIKNSCLALAGTDENAFRPSRPGHCLTDLQLLVKQRLQNLGVERIYGGQYSTYIHSRLFYSYRKEGTTGRIASLIWMDSS